MSEYIATASLGEGIVATARLGENITASVEFTTDSPVIIMSEEMIQKTYKAGDTVGGQRVVMVEGGKVVHYDPTDENNTGKTLGVSNNAGILDDDILVTHAGSSTSGGWGLITDSVYYAGANGTLTTVVPSSGILQRVGVATSPTTLLIQFSEPITLI